MATKKVVAKSAPKASAAKPKLAATKKVVAKAKAAPAKKTAVKPKAKPAKKVATPKGTRYICEVCGLAVIVDTVCGCTEVCDLICCGKDMKVKKAR